MSVILITTPFYKALILQGEICCWSLLGIKGLTSVGSRGEILSEMEIDADFWPGQRIS